ncbi:hypothetical protein BS78_08G027500 [Paspalum vaginatum]|nr:hypothetical protein BS78_08G027500 [Paspalum vaginatum]
MAVPVARVHLAMAHAALPALFRTPPKWKKMMMPLLTTTTRKPGRADSDERWDARKMEPAASPASSSSGKSSSTGRASSRDTRDRNTKTPSCKPGRSDSVDRWDAHKKPANAAVTLLSDQHCSNRALSAAHKNPLLRPPHANTSCIADDGDSSSTGSNGESATRRWTRHSHSGARLC